MLPRPLFIATVSIVDTSSKPQTPALAGEVWHLEDGRAGAGTPEEPEWEKRWELRGEGGGYFFKSGDLPPGGLFTRVGAGCAEAGSWRPLESGSLRSSPGAWRCVWLASRITGWVLATDRAGWPLVRGELACPQTLGSPQTFGPGRRRVFLGSRAGVPPSRGSHPPPGRAVRGTRIFASGPFRTRSVRTPSQEAGGDGGRGAFLWVHRLTAVGTLTLSGGVRKGGGGRGSPPPELTSPARASPPPPPMAWLS